MEPVGDWAEVTGTIVEIGDKQRCQQAGHHQGEAEGEDNICGETENAHQLGFHLQTERLFFILKHHRASQSQEQKKKIQIIPKETCDFEKFDSLPAHTEVHKEVKCTEYACQCCGALL